MFDHLSNSWLIGIGFALCLILVFTFYKIQNALSQLLHPFKKGKTYWCRITAISDGDTLTCYRFNFRRSETKLRFAYIYAPESTQSYGPESKRLIKKMVYRKVVRVRITDIDRFGRCVGEIYRFRRSMNEEMVKRGAAWVYEDYIKDKKHLKHMNALQSHAKKHKKGLWRGTRPIRPSDYRKMKK